VPPLSPAAPSLSPQPLTAAPSTWTCSNLAAPQLRLQVISPLLAPALPDPPLSHYPAQYSRPTSSEVSTAPEVPVGCGQGSGRWRRRPCTTAVQGPCQRFARNCATRNLAPPHLPMLGSAFHLGGCVATGGSARRCELPAHRWHARGQGFKSPQLHQAQRIGRIPAQGRLPEICQDPTISDR
jgi:hypothetical protein